MVVRFDWLEGEGEEGGNGRPMVLRRSVPGCWAVFLRAVEEARVWKGQGEEGKERTEGRANVRVKVVMR